MTALTSTPRRIYAKIIIGAVVFCALSAFFLTGSGMCFREGRYLSKKELIDGYLFGSRAAEMTEVQKADEIKARGGKYPDCCLVEEKPAFLSDGQVLMNAVVGRYLFGVETQFPAPKNFPSSHPYLATYASVDACGVATGRGNTGLQETHAEYISALQRIREHWNKIK